MSCGLYLTHLVYILSEYKNYRFSKWYSGTWTGSMGCIEICFWFGWFIFSWFLCLSISQFHRCLYRYILDWFHSPLNNSLLGVISQIYDNYLDGLILSLVWVIRNVLVLSQHNKFQVMVPHKNISINLEFLSTGTPFSSEVLLPRYLSVYWQIPWFCRFLWYWWVCPPFLYHPNCIFLEII